MCGDDCCARAAETGSRVGTLFQTGLRSQKTSAQCLGASQPVLSPGWASPVTAATPTSEALPRPLAPEIPGCSRTMTAARSRRRAIQPRRWWRARDDRVGSGGAAASAPRQRAILVLTEVVGCRRPKRAAARGHLESVPALQRAHSTWRAVPTAGGLGTQRPVRRARRC